MLDESFRNSLHVQPAFAQLEEHSSANKFDFSTSKKFKFVGDIFIAETSFLPPVTGAEDLTGYKVVRVDRESGEGSDFIAHTAQTPDVIFDPSGFNKPIDVKFLGSFMLVVDFGVFEPGLNLNQPGTGKIWVVFHGGLGNLSAPESSPDTSEEAATWLEMFAQRMDAFVPLISH